jgi:putative Holliday junction resolvase
MKTLGLDIGSKRIGLALSDEDGTFAFPSGKLDRKGRKKDLAALCELIVREAVGQIVIGLPIHLDGRRGKGAEAAQTFADDLAAASGLPVEMVDERLTSVEAERVLRAGGTSAKKMRGVVDSIAASIILRTWLDMRDHARSRGDDAS